MQNPIKNGLVPILLLCLLSLDARAATKIRSRHSTLTESQSLDQEPSWSRFRFNTMIGVQVLSGSGFFSGSQFGYAPVRHVPLYIGPEIDFTLFSTGSLFSTLVGGWYEISLARAYHLSLLVGAVAGPGFASGLAGIPTTAAAEYADIVLAQQIDELFFIRGQFRPGVVYTKVAMLVDFSVGFRL